MIIYKAVNKINGNTYIGKTVNTLNYRKSGHINAALKRNNNTYFHKAIRKYGKENFEWSVIQTCITENHLNLAEQAYIELYKIKGIKLYNMTEGGEGTVGFKPSKETRKNMSKRTSGENNPMYGKKGHLAPSFGKPGTMLGKNQSDESKEKIRQALIGRVFSEKHRKKLSLSGIEKHKGKNHSKSKKVYQIDINTNEIIKTWDCLREAARDLNVSHANLSRACNNPKKISNGFRWAYVKNSPL